MVSIITILHPSLSPFYQTGSSVVFQLSRAYPQKRSFRLQVECLVIDEQEMYDGEKTKQTMASQVGITEESWKKKYDYW